MRKNGKDASLSLQDTLLVLALFLANVSYFCKNVIWLSGLLPACEVISLTVLIFLCIDPAKWKKVCNNKLPLLVAMFVCGLISYVISAESLLLYYTLLTICVSTAKFSKIYKIDLLVKIVTTILVVGSYRFGLTEAIEFTRGEQSRETFGFIHPNTLGFIAVSIFSDVMVLAGGVRRHKIKATILYMLCIIVLILADSRTAIVIITMIYILGFLKPIKLKGLVRKLLMCTPFILAAFTIALTICYGEGGNVFRVLNDLLSSRLRLQLHYLDNYGITLFGSKVTSFTKYPLDNAYMKTLVSTGIIGLMLILIYNSLSLYQFMQKDKNRNVMYNVVFLVYALSEMIALRPVVTLSLVMRSDDLLTGKGENENQSY